MGRRWGKTLMAGAYVLACANQGGAVAWVVPTYKNARPVWRFCERLVGHLAGVVKINRTERTIQFPSGGWLGIYSADNDTAIRGEAFDVVVVDEAAQVSPETYTDVILATLADRDGRCLLISTPKGLNWFHTEYVNALRDGVDRAAWRAPTSSNPMPTIQRAALLAKERVTERAYRQEWLAEFISDGSVFRKVGEAATAKPEGPVAGRHYVFGVDWGKVADFTVVSVLDAATRRQVALERFNQIDYAVQVPRLEALAERYRPRLIVAEANSVGIPLLEQLHRLKLPVYGWQNTNASKAAVIEALGLALERGKITLLDEPIQTAELLAYEARRTATGMVQYGAPEGMHDDTVMALALAWAAAVTPSGRPTQRSFSVS